MVITTAPESNDDEFDRRRKRYALMMAGRALCVVAAALTYHVSLILALAFILGGTVLPWCAVIIANDRPPLRRAQRGSFRGSAQEKALPGHTDRTVDG